MASKNITQIRRLVFRSKASASDAWTVYSVEPENLGQDTIISYSATPRTVERASQTGTTSVPIPGTFDELTASVTVLADTYAIIGRILGNWNAATYEGADTNAGQMLIGAGTANYCAGQTYVSVIAQGVCDDGSEVDVEFTRCYPQIDGDFEIGSSETPTVTFALNPQIYNSVTHADDGYPQYTGRLGEYDLTQKMRLNVTTGDYEAVSTDDDESSEGE